MFQNLIQLSTFYPQSPDAPGSNSSKPTPSIVAVSSLLLKVNNKLKELERKNFGKEAPISVVVVGCGYSGVKLAATVSQRLKGKGIVQAVNVENTICRSALKGKEAPISVVVVGFYCDIIACN